MRWLGINHRMSHAMFDNLSSTLRNGLWMLLNDPERQWRVLICCQHIYRDTVELMVYQLGCLHTKRYHASCWDVWCRLVLGAFMGVLATEKIWPLIMSLRYRSLHRYQ